MASSPAFEVFNLGGSSVVTLLDLVKTIQELCGRKAKIKRMPSQPGDLKSHADVSKAQQLLDYNPTTYRSSMRLSGSSSGSSPTGGWYTHRGNRFAVREETLQP